MVQWKYLIGIKKYIQVPKEVSGTQVLWGAAEGTGVIGMPLWFLKWKYAGDGKS